MKEKIYTIPVTEAFQTDCECPMCVMEKKLEEEYLTYFLGPSLMEPDCRIDTNDKGFCRRHFELLYNRQENRLGLGLILDTHLTEQNKKLRKLYEDREKQIKKDAQASLFQNASDKLLSKPNETERLLKELIAELDSLQKKCAICGKLEYTMDRYTDVILYLWFRESDFKDTFNSRKGFCLKHLKFLLEGAVKYLNRREAAIFLQSLMELQLPNLERIQQEVSWFTQKFDYRNNDAPWGNSRDAVPRSIQKLTGYSELK